MHVSVLVGAPFLLNSVPILFFILRPTSIYGPGWIIGIVMEGFGQLMLSCTIMWGMSNPDIQPVKEPQQQILVFCLSLVWLVFHIAFIMSAWVTQCLAVLISALIVMSVHVLLFGLACQSLRNAVYCNKESKK